MALPAPKERLQVESLSAGPPGKTRAFLQNVSFELRAGSALGIIGPSASGKSTLARALVGAWMPQDGTVRLDGAALERWDPVELGRHIGYLPQNIELFDGSIAQNIARFDPGASPDSIVAAAKEAAIHDMILRFPEGYDTQIGEGGVALSVGQRQRVALARALYGNPFLLVLDEPNAHLDAEGDAALTAAILGVRRRGGLAVIVAHRPSALAGVDLLLVLAGGQMQAFGPRDEVLRRATQMPAAAAEAAQHPGYLRVISDTASSA